MIILATWSIAFLAWIRLIFLQSCFQEYPILDGCPAGTSLNFSYDTIFEPSAPRATDWHLQSTAENHDVYLIGASCELHKSEFSPSANSGKQRATLEWLRSALAAELVDDEKVNGTFSVNRKDLCSQHGRGLAHQIYHWHIWNPSGCACQERVSCRPAVCVRCSNAPLSDLKRICPGSRVASSCRMLIVSRDKMILSALIQDFQLEGWNIGIIQEDASH